MQGKRQKKHLGSASDDDRIRKTNSLMVNDVAIWDMVADPKTTLSLSEESALIDIIQTGTPTDVEDAFDALYRRYAPQMMSFLSGRVIGLDQRQDIAARVWAKAVVTLGTFEKRDDAKTDKPFKSWLMSATRFMMLEDFRANEKETELSSALTAQQIVDYVDQRTKGEPELELNPIEQQKLEQIVDAAMNELKFDLDRAVIQLAFFEYPPCNAPEIARRLNMSPASVRQRKSRALMRLKPLLEKHLRSSKQ